MNPNLTKDDGKSCVCNSGLTCLYHHLVVDRGGNTQAGLDFKHQLTVREMISAGELCGCDNWECDNPHSLIELKIQQETLQALSGETMQAPEAKCPRCQTEAYPYDIDGVWLAWCNPCAIDFIVSTGEILPDDIDGGIVKAEPKRHVMAMDADQLWTCSACTFETQFISEVNQHEGNDLRTVSETKADLHFVEPVKDTSMIGGKRSWKCKYCSAAEFTDWNEASKHENASGRLANGYGADGNKVSSTPTTSYKSCTHKPTHVIELGNGAEVWAGNRWGCQDSLDKFDVVLNLTGSSVGKRHHIPIPELSKWERTASFTEICLDWPDRGIVSLPKAFWKDLLNHLKKNKLKMVVFCVGGHGRTGTAVASMLVTELKWEPQKATEWVWNNYCKDAIETDGQISYVYNLVGKKYNPPKKAETNIITHSFGQTTLL